MAVGLFVGWASTQSAAATLNSGDNLPAAQAASQSVGKNGSRLKWLPQRPDSAQAETTVNAVQYKTSSNATGTVRTAQNLSPTLAEEMSSQVLEEPKPQGSMPEPRAGKPSGVETPYVAPNGLNPSNQASPQKSAPKQSFLERENNVPQLDLTTVCPSPKDLKPIAELSTNIVPPEGEVPHDCPLGNATFQTRAFSPITYTWTASGLCHKPLYFEDVQLERYGHMAGPWLQPLASGAHFFLTIPILPYKMGLETPDECMYTLGYYRPGDCAPYLFDPIPLSVRGALFEAGAWVGGVAIIP